MSNSNGPNGNVSLGGWLNGQGSADTWKGTVTSASSVAVGANASPNGGIFAGGAVWNTTHREEFYTELTDLTPGEVYEVSFFQANGGASAYGQQTPVGEAVRWEVTFGSEVQFSADVTFTGFGNQQWVAEKLTFTATQATQKLSFIADHHDQFGFWKYALIDDIKVQAPNQPGRFDPIDLLANDTDPDGHKLTVVQLNGQLLEVGVPIPLSNGLTATQRPDGLIQVEGPVVSGADDHI